MTRFEVNAQIEKNKKNYLIKCNRLALSNALKLNKELQNLQDSLVQARCSCGLGSTSIVKMGGGSSNSSIQERKPELIMELENKIKELEEDLKIEKKIVERKIENLGLDNDDEQLLIYRYVDCRQWYDIQCLLGVTKRHAHRLEVKILAEINL